VVSQLIIKLSDYSQHLSSSELARALRGKVLGEKVLFDFSDVQSVSESFFEELFGMLLESYGEKKYTEHVSCIGLSLGHQQLLQGILRNHMHKR